MEISTLLTPEEAAQFLRIPKETMSYWRVKGVGPAFIKVGHAVRYSRSALEEYLKTRTRNGTPVRQELNDII